MAMVLIEEVHPFWPQVIDTGITKFTNHFGVELMINFPFVWKTSNAVSCVFIEIYSTFLVSSRNPWWMNNDFL
jgi:hypothetical protein